MQISSRFTNYALTGAFFFISHLLFLVVFNEHVTAEAWEAWVASYEKYARFPEAFKNVADTLLTTVGLISIFFVGLVLELMGSYFFISERKVFIHHLKRNHDWLEHVFNDAPKVLKANYDYLRNEPTALVWSPSHLIKIICKHGAFNHLHAYLFSYIHVNSGESVSDLLYDHRNLWRVARAIANTLILLAIEMLILEIHVTIFELEVKAFIILLLVFALAAYITIQSYNRMCCSLFALTYTSYNKNKQ